MPRRGADQRGELLLRHHLVEGPGLEIELRMGACDPIERDRRAAPRDDPDGLQPRLVAGEDRRRLGAERVADDAEPLRVDVVAC